MKTKIKLVYMNFFNCNLEQVFYISVNLFVSLIFEKKKQKQKYLKKKINSNHLN
jgi:hypothetical protein